MTTTTFRNYIAGDWVAGATAIANRNPSDVNDIIGEYALADIPTSEGTGVKKERIDFNSHQVVLDAMGGSKAVPPEIDNSKFDVPALSLVVRNDGTVVVRNQALDQTDEVRKSIDENYKREKEESTKKRETSSMYGASAAF